MSDIARHFGQNVARHRVKAGLTQEALAHRCAVHRTQISLIEAGSREPRLATIVKLAGSLDVPLEVLLAGIVWVPPRMQTGEFKFAPPKKRAK